MSINLEYLITGTGRCGTVYMARCLTDWGIPCGHESIFNFEGLTGAERRLNGTTPISLSNTSKMEWTPKAVFFRKDYVDVNKGIKAESSYMAAPYLNLDIFKDVKIIHVVRHPFFVINSFLNHITYFRNESSNSYEIFIYRNLPTIKSESLSHYEKAALYYIEWNELIEKHSDFFQKIEDPLEDLKSFLNVTGPDFPDKSINTYRKKIDSFFDITYVENKDIRDRLVNKGESYGYNMTSKYLLI